MVTPALDFDWNKLDQKGFGTGYSKKELEDISSMYNSTFNELGEKTVVKARIVGITDREVILNVGFKSDGLVSLSEFRDTPDIKVGDEVDVFVETQEDRLGQLILSRKKAKLVVAWKMIEDALANDTIIEGFVKRRTKGGLIIDVFNVEAFLPGSQIDVKPIRDFDVYVNKKMEVKVVKINYTNDNVVVSHKVLIEKDLEEQKSGIINNLEKGQILEGTVKNITNFGVFVDLGGVDGLLHITDISWGRVNHPQEVLQLDQKIQVCVLEFDDEKKRISLGMKQLTAHPWDALTADIILGSKVKGKIVNIADYGAFLEIITGVEGLIHVSEMSWSQHLKTPAEFMKIGDEMEAVVLTIDREERKMSLGIKQLTEDPWSRQEFLNKYSKDTKHKGTVRNLTNFGLFIELEEGVDGLVHVSDLSWTKKIKHPSEFVKVGDTLEVVVLEVDAENKRLALSHKHLEENPWDTFETVFTVGSQHKGTINSKIDKGAFIELPYGIEGFSTLKNITKEDGTMSEVGESLYFVVLEFSKDDRRIFVSHAKTYQAGKKAEEVVVEESASSDKKKAAKKVEVKVEKETFGDIAALSNLKTGGEEKPKVAKKTKAE
ncbi:MAG: 30S ribosomal protein S1 [Cytophagales bacterium]|nr:MAG: 30S ribosomal protein S1 [Cytophagales bacterium]